MISGLGGSEEITTSGVLTNQNLTAVLPDNSANVITVAASTLNSRKKQTPINKPVAVSSCDAPRVSNFFLRPIGRLQTILSEIIFTELSSNFSFRSLMLTSNPSRR